MGKAVKKQNERTVLLNIGIDEQYLLRRHQILCGAGFDVIDATSVEEALTIASHSGIRVAIFGHRVPAIDRLTISDGLKRTNPGIRLVVMYNNSVSRTESADAVLRVDVSPDDLIHTVQYLLSSGRSGSTAPAVG